MRLCCGCPGHSEEAIVRPRQDEVTKDDDTPIFRRKRLIRSKTSPAKFAEMRREEINKIELARAHGTESAAFVSKTDSEIISGSPRIATISSLIRTAKTFRHNVAKALEPSLAERDRGVKVESVYDFFDPAKGKATKLKMSDDVVHRRSTISDAHARRLGHSNTKLLSSAVMEGVRKSGGLLPSLKEDDSDDSPLSESSCSSSDLESMTPVSRSLSEPVMIRVADDLKRSSAIDDGVFPSDSKVHRTSTMPASRSSGRNLKTRSGRGTSSNSPRRSARVSRRSSTCSSNSSAELLNGSEVRTPPKADDLPVRVPSFMRQASLEDRNKEIICTWGVIVGRLLHLTVTNFEDLLGKAADKGKRASHKDRSSSVLVREFVRKRAAAVLRTTRKLIKAVASETIDRFDAEWNCSIVKLLGTDYVDALMILANAAYKVVMFQSVLVEVQPPVRVFGDIHGQFRDLLMFFHAYGFPSEDGPSFVFNGDFVDRGCHQLETISLLLALKLILPGKIWLIRGNHEDRYMNDRYGFTETCNSLLGQDWGPAIFEAIHKVFDWLPVASLISERILVVHGGIGDGMWRLGDLRALRRPLNETVLEREENVWVKNLLWSDPIEDGKTNQDVFGVHESPRGGRTTEFAWNVTKTFCAVNGLSLIVRSHQSKHESPGFDVMHENLLVRVFSARDYEGHGNDGATLLIEHSESRSMDASPSSRDQILRVRPQVLRSVTKARREALGRAVSRPTRRPSARDSRQRTPLASEEMAGSGSAISSASNPGGVGNQRTKPSTSDHYSGPVASPTTKTGLSRQSSHSAPRTTSGSDSNSSSGSPRSMPPSSAVRPHR